MRIALDLMGGDHAPTSVLEGALRAPPELEIILVGPKDLAARLLDERGATDRCRLVDASEVIDMTEDPAKAVRAKRDATIRVAHQLVRNGEADAVVSIGSTGATLAAAVITLGRVTSRPALAVVVPAVAGQVVLLDAGATAEGTVEQLVQHAILGAAYAQTLGVADPRVGLLNVGEERGKGDQPRKDAYDALSAAPICFVGNVEGQDVSLGGAADVVVTDGFTGNVLLKGIEGATTRAGGGGLPVCAAAGGQRRHRRRARRRERRRRRRLHHGRRGGRGARTGRAAARDTGDRVMTPDQVLEVIASAVATVLEVPASSVTRETRFMEDLKADSLALVEIVEIIEEELARGRAGFRIDDEDLDDLTTVGEALDYALSRLS